MSATENDSQRRDRGNEGGQRGDGSDGVRAGGRIIGRTGPTLAERVGELQKGGDRVGEMQKGAGRRMWGYIGEESKSLIPSIWNEKIDVGLQTVWSPEGKLEDTNKSHESKGKGSKLVLGKFGVGVDDWELGPCCQDMREDSNPTAGGRVMLHGYVWYHV